MNVAKDNSLLGDQTNKQNNKQTTNKQRQSKQIKGERKNSVGASEQKQETKKYRSQMKRDLKTKSPYKKRISLTKSCTSSSL